MNKHLIWHELYDHMHDDKCPLCEHTRLATAAGMQTLLHEGVLDVGLRKQIYDSNGLCHRHAHQLVQMGDPLAHAVIYAGLFERAVTAFETKADRSAGLYQQHEKCMFCLSEKTSEKLYVPVFVKAFSEHQFSERYRRSGLLCLPHLARAVSYDKRRSEAIVEVTLEKYKALLGRLTEIMRKNDYRAAHEPWTEEEKTAWKAAVDIFNGA